MGIKTNAHAPTTMPFLGVSSIRGETRLDVPTIHNVRRAQRLARRRLITGQD